MVDIDVDPTAVAAADDWISVGRWASEQGADDCAVVLQAVGIPSSVAPIDAASGGGFALLVYGADADRAREQLTKFAEENRGWPARAYVPPPLTMGVGAALVYAALMLIAFQAARQQSYGLNWVSIGAADAALIRSGEWWRAITALSLHIDLDHLAGNVLFGALFGVMLAQSVGAGAAWLIFVIAGSVGNMVNAWWQPPSHVAIGASTGVFGLLGAQVAWDLVRRARLRRHPMRRWAPIILGVALLAWFGGSGERQIDPTHVATALNPLTDVHRVDIAAHVFGFLTGIGVGAALGGFSSAWLARARSQSVMTAFALGLTLLAWGLAAR